MMWDKEKLQVLTTEEMEVFDMFILKSKRPILMIINYSIDWETALIF